MTICVMSRSSSRWKDAVHGVAVAALRRVRMEDDEEEEEDACERSRLA
jgi:hypothetical protein